MTEPGAETIHPRAKSSAASTSVTAPGVYNKGTPPSRLRREAAESEPSRRPEPLARSSGIPAQRQPTPVSKSATHAAVQVTAPPQPPAQAAAPPEPARQVAAPPKPTRQIAAPPRPVEPITTPPRQADKVTSPPRPVGVIASPQPAETDDQPRATNRADRCPTETKRRGDRLTAAGRTGHSPPARPTDHPGQAMQAANPATPDRRHRIHTDPAHLQAQPRSRLSQCRPPRDQPSRPNPATGRTSPHTRRRPPGQPPGHPHPASGHTKPHAQRRPPGQPPTSRYRPHQASRTTPPAWPAAQPPTSRFRPHQASRTTPRARPTTHMPLRAYTKPHLRRRLPDNQSRAIPHSRLRPPGKQPSQHRPRQPRHSPQAPRRSPIDPRHAKCRQPRRIKSPANAPGTPHRPRPPSQAVLLSHSPRPGAALRKTTVRPSATAERWPTAERDGMHVGRRARPAA